MNLFTSLHATHFITSYLISHLPAHQYVVFFQGPDLLRHVLVLNPSHTFDHPCSLFLYPFQLCFVLFEAPEQHTGFKIKATDSYSDRIILAFVLFFFPNNS